MTTRGGAFWLRLDDGTRIRVAAGGLLIGRDAGCDLLLSDRHASRVHALVRPGAGGLELVVLGKNPVVVNGAPIRGSGALAHGDELSLPGQTVRVAIEGGTRRRPATWAVEHQGGARYGIAHSPFAFGGSALDDVMRAGWPAGALRFHLAQQALFVEVVVPARINGKALAKARVEPLAVGDLLEVRGERFHVGVASRASDSTLAAAATPLPSVVRIEFMARGGRLVLRFPDGERSVYLVDKRCDLVAALLRPPRPLGPGEYVADDLLLPLVWPRRQDADRTDLNVLLFRIRKDLVRAGINGVRLIERSPGGGATRFALADAATVSVA